jgi:hypothetical protein
LKNVGIVISAAVAAIIALASIFAAAASSSSSQLLPAGTGIGSESEGDQPAEIAVNDTSGGFAVPEKEQQLPPADQPEKPAEKKAMPAAAEISFQKPSALDYQRIERGIQKLVNEHREEMDLGPVKTSFDLYAVAGRHSASMSANGYLGHADPFGFDAIDRYLLEGVSCPFAVTNEGVESLFRSRESVLGMAEPEIARMAFEGLSRSAIENPGATQVGIGASSNGEGTLYVAANVC